MGDLFGDWVPDEWIQAVFKACEAAPWHRYLFLTKNVKRLYRLADFNRLPPQHWYGGSVENDRHVTCIAQGRGAFSSYMDNKKAFKTFLSIEPLQDWYATNRDDFNLREGLFVSWLSRIDLVIVGQETGNRKAKITPKPEWITNVVNACRDAGVPVFLKNNLAPVMGEEYVKSHQSLPWRELA